MSLKAYILALAPELIVLFGACLVLLLGRRDLRRQPPAAPLAAFVTLSVALGVAFLTGVPEEPRLVPGLWLGGLTFYIRLIGLAVGAVLVLVNWHQAVEDERGEYLSMILFSLLGVLLTASADDLLVLLFALELVSVPTYVLIALSRSSHRAGEAAVKYFFLGALATALLAYGLSFLYGVMGTTALHRVTDAGVVSTLGGGSALETYALIGLLLVFAGVAFKMAAVPFHVYAPDVYEGAAAPVTGLLGFAPKAAGFVALLRLFDACAWDLPQHLFWLLWIVAAATMTVGNVVALLQTNVKRMLAYSSIAHTGYILIALLVGPATGEGPLRDGVAAVLFYLPVYGLMNLGAFALIGAFRIDEREPETLDELAGLARRAPAESLTLGVFVFSLMGFPPTAGMLAKVFVFGSAFSAGSAHPHRLALIVLAVIGVANAAIAAAYYLRIVTAVYMKNEGCRCLPAQGGPIRLGLLACALPLLLVFVWPGALTHEARRASAHVHPPTLRLAAPALTDPPPTPVAITARTVATSTAGQP
ncbi:MAG TPA: NADH-quinone oxidoreductase subunit N [Phycisphaerae bacterium]|nr:NADH-quinone oxidoreductase subunit N [Phycisphaerae bacterium]HNU44914.1 NADH-quinone oxidoreductase subunit N [Phycisphaerae bacterium]